MLPASPSILQVALSKSKAMIYKSLFFQRKKCDLQRTRKVELEGTQSLAVTLRGMFVGGPPSGVPECWEVPKLCSAWWSFQATEN